MVGALPAAGRLLNNGDDMPASAAAPAVVITDRLWQRIFGGDATAVGATLLIDGTPATIVGVTARGFFGLQTDSGSDVFVPLAAYSSVAAGPKRPQRARNVIGRLAPGVTIEQARAEVLARWPAIQAATTPASLPQAEQTSAQSQRVAIESAATGFSTLRRLYGASLPVLVGCAAMLLLVTCVNLTGLLLARGLWRQHQFDVRVALGASRGRLFQQALLDGLVLAVCSLAVALPLAWWSSHVVTSMVSFARVTPLRRPLTPDLAVLAIAVVAALATGLLVGILPAWRAAHGRADAALRAGRGVVRGFGRPGKVLLLTQVALSMVLVVGAGLFSGTLSRLHANVDHVMTQPIVWTRLSRNPGDRGTPVDRRYFQDLVGQLSAIPGADRAALSLYFPAALGNASGLPTQNFAPLAEGEPSAVASGLTEFISPGFFDMFRVARLRGRDFTWDDDERSPAVAIVSESLARKLYPDGEVVGRHVRVSVGPTRTDLAIVGVVADVPIGGIREPNMAVVYRPMMQELTRAQAPNAFVRVSSDSAAVREAYVGVVDSQRRHLVRGLFTLEEWIGFSLLRESFIARLSLSAAVLVVLLACIGLYAQLAYAVASRVREIGVRMALGASRASVLLMIVRDGLFVVVPGVLIGVPCALAAGTLVRSQLYGLGANDPTTIVRAAVVFTVTGFAAALLPALRASKIDPIDTLRQE
jgi:predicted permease